MSALFYSTDLFAMNLRNLCTLFVLFSLCAPALGQAPPAKPAPAIRITPAVRTVPAKPLPSNIKAIPANPAKRTPATPDQATKPSAPIPSRPDAPTQAKPVGAPDEPEKSPRDLLHDALKAVKFDRTPDGILNAVDALSQKPKPEKDKNKAISERFRLLANAGRWSELGRYIKSLPHNQTAETAYRHLIRSITRPPATRPPSTPASPSSFLACVWKGCSGGFSRFLARSAFLASFCACSH